MTPRIKLLDAAATIPRSFDDDNSRFAARRPIFDACLVATAFELGNDCIRRRPQPSADAVTAECTHSGNGRRCGLYRGAPRPMPAGQAQRLQLPLSWSVANPRQSGPIQSDNGICPLQPAKNFAWADGRWETYSTYQANIHASVVTRHVFRSQNGQKCVGSRNAAPNPAEELIALHRHHDWTKGREGEEKEGRDERRERRGKRRVRQRKGRESREKGNGRGQGRGGEGNKAGVGKGRGKGGVWLPQLQPLDPPLVAVRLLCPRGEAGRHPQRRSHSARRTGGGGKLPRYRHHDATPLVA